MNSEHSDIRLRQVSFIGVMAAAVYVASVFLQIPIPTAIDNTRLHMGNVLCLLSGLLLGPVPGGFAAGIGSMFFDLTNPAYVTSAPFTFAFKFIMAWVCGKLAAGHIAPAGQAEPTGRAASLRQSLPSERDGHRRIRYVVGASAGSALYVALYLAKSFLEHRYVMGIPLQAVLLTVSQKAVVSGVNAAVSVLVAVPLGIALRPAVARLMRQN